MRRVQEMCNKIMCHSAISSDEAAFDSQSSSVIKLNNSTVLYLREVNKFLSLVCILREDNFSRQGVIDYNVLCFREAISQVFELRSQALSKIMETSVEALDDEDDDDEDDDGHDDGDDVDGGVSARRGFGKKPSDSEGGAAVRSPENGGSGTTGGSVLRSKLAATDRNNDAASVLA